MEQEKDMTSLLPLRYDPDPILALVCRRVPDVTDRIRDLARQMILTMHAEEGAGLAAPQVGESLRLFVSVSPHDPSVALVFINPEFVVKSTEMVTGAEGCLSFPGRTVQVARHGSVTLRAQDLSGKSFLTRAEGFFARCLQHEVDHLYGNTIFPITRCP